MPTLRANNVGRKTAAFFYHRIKRFPSPVPIVLNRRIFAPSTQRTGTFRAVPVRTTFPPHYYNSTYNLEIYVRTRSPCWNLRVFFVLPRDTLAQPLVTRKREPPKAGSISSFPDARDDSYCPVHRVVLTSNLLSLSFPTYVRNDLVRWAIPINITPCSANAQP